MIANLVKEIGTEEISKIIGKPASEFVIHFSTIEEKPEKSVLFFILLPSKI